MTRPLVILALAAACGGGQLQTTMPAAPAGGVETQPVVATADPVVARPAPVVAAKAQKIRTVEGITEYALDNGLQVLLFPDATQSTVTVNVTYLVGSRHEGYGETGMAHLLEHMLFKGSKNHGNSMKAFDERTGAVVDGAVDVASDIEAVMGGTVVRVRFAVPASSTGQTLTYRLQFE